MDRQNLQCRSKIAEVGRAVRGEIKMGDVLAFTLNVLHFGVNQNEHEQRQHIVRRQRHFLLFFCRGAHRGRPSTARSGGDQFGIRWRSVLEPSFAVKRPVSVWESTPH